MGKERGAVSKMEQGAHIDWQGICWREQLLERGRKWQVPEKNTYNVALYINSFRRWGAFVNAYPSPLQIYAEKSIPHPLTVPCLLAERKILTGPTYLPSETQNRIVNMVPSQ